MLTENAVETGGGKKKKKKKQPYVGWGCAEFVLQLSSNDCDHVLKVMNLILVTII